MPPKQKEKLGKGKQGKPIKEIIPSHIKNPYREGIPMKVIEEAEPKHEYTYKPYNGFPEWPGLEAAKEHDFTGERNEDGTT
jgi:hypothetical protein